MTARKYDLKVFSSRLKLLMKQKGITQEQLADSIGCSRKTISQYCNNKSIPDDFNRKRLADFFHVSIQYLLGETDYPSIGAKADAMLGEEKLKELRFEVELLTRFEKSFQFHCEEYTDAELEKLDLEIREFIKFKISQLKRKDGGKWGK